MSGTAIIRGLVGNRPHRIASKRRSRCARYRGTPDNRSDSLSVEIVGFQKTRLAYHGSPPFRIDAVAEILPPHSPQIFAVGLLKTVVFCPPPLAEFSRNYFSGLLSSVSGLLIILEAGK